MTKWMHRKESPMPFQNWCPFNEEDYVEVASAHGGDTKTGLAKDFWWGYKTELGQTGEGVIVKARKVKHKDLPNGWRPMKDAPKLDLPSPYSGPWILGIDRSDEQRVMRWTVEYPRTEGCWMFAYESTDYIDNIQEFYPVAWQELPGGLR